MPDAETTDSVLPTQYNCIFKATVNHKHISIMQKWVFQIMGNGAKKSSSKIGLVLKLLGSIGLMSLQDRAAIQHWKSNTNI